MRSKWLVGGGTVVAAALVVTAWGRIARQPPKAGGQVSRTTGVAGDAAAVESPLAGAEGLSVEREATPGADLGTRAAAPSTRGIRVQVVSAADGSALEGAHMSVEQPADAPAPNSAEGVEARTDAAGEAWLPLGTVGKLAVSLRDFVPRELEFEPDVRDVRLELWPAVAVEVLVVDAFTGLPIKSVSVQALQSTMGVSWARGARTFAGGRAELRLVAAGLPLELRANKRGYEPVRRNIATASAGELLRLELKPLGQVHGTVTWADGAPAAGAVVIGVSNGGSLASAPQEIGPTGEFEITGLALDTWLHLLALSPGGGGSRASEPFQMLQTGESRQLDLVLDAVRGSLSVHVVDERGHVRPAAEVSVVRAPDSEGPRKSLDSLAALRRETDRQGTAQFQGLPVGEYRVVVSGGMAAEWKGGANVGRDAETSLRAVLPRQVPLRGLVLSPAGVPFNGVVLEFRQGEAVALAWVERDGHFELEGLLEQPGTLIAVVSGRGDDALLGTVATWSSVVPGDEEQLFRVPALGRLEGRIAPPPEPSESFSLAFGLGSEDVSPEGEQNIRPDAEGRFSVAFQPHSVPFDAHLHRWGNEGRSLRLQVPAFGPGETVSLGLLNFRTGLHAAGFVRDLEGRPVEGAKLYVSAEESMDRTEVTDAAGRFQIDDLFTGPAEVGLWAKGYARQHFELEDTSDLDGRVIVLLPLAKVAVRFRSHSGDSRGDPTLLLEPVEDNNPRHGVHGRGNAFELAVEPQPYRIWYRAFGQAEWTRGPDITLEPGELRELEFELP